MENLLNVLAPIMAGIVNSLGRFFLYICPCVVILVLIHFFVKVPKFVFRKLLHLVAFMGVTMMILMADDWVVASLTFVVITIVIYPVLMILEKKSWYSDFFVEKKPGEIKLSLLLLFLMFAVLIAVSWGVFQHPDIGACAILMWGFGDAMAALVGIPFGKHKILFKPVNGKKSVEGTLAMFTISFLCGWLFLCLYSGYDAGKAILVALVASLVGSLTELFSSSELDTVTVPVAILMVLLFI